MARLLAPILSFTMEEIWPHLGESGSVHMAYFPDPAELTEGIHSEQRARVDNWNRLIGVRDSVLKSLEAARQDKSIGAPLDARVQLSAGHELFALLEEYSRELPGLFIVSQVDVSNHTSEGVEVKIERARGVKCGRCWKYTEDVGSVPEFPGICAACAEAVREIAANG
jgi:isoleucyl-tRNA synthetase